MLINPSSSALFAGVDNLSLDQRKFDPTHEDIESICRFFSIGKLQHYEKEKDVVVSHSNFFVFAATTQGQYALKFYPADAAQTIAIEYTINHFLISHNFPTPLMYLGKDGQSSLAFNGRLATCFSYINGLQAWHSIKEQNVIHQINATMLSLKNILSTSQRHIPILKQDNFTATINKLIQTSRAASFYDDKKIIDTYLQDACRTYQEHQSLFKRQWLHNNATLTNFLIDKEIIYTLDLSHVLEDYILSDLAALIISCLFLDIPAATVKVIIDDHFTQHKIGTEYFSVLNTLVRIGLIREYLKNVQRENSADHSNSPSTIIKTYLFHLTARKKSILAVLKNMETLSLKDLS